VACAREGKIKSVAEGQEALSAGAKGMFLENQPKVNGKTLLSEPHVLSTVGGNGGAAVTKPPRLSVTAT